MTSLTLPDGAVEQWSYLGTGETSRYTSPLGYFVNYTFDAGGRHTGVDYPSGTDTAFAYDASGRLLSMTDGTGVSSWTYNAADEITALNQPQGNLTYAYNLAGQRTTLTEVGLGSTTTAYDSFGLVQSVANRFGETTSLLYDSQGWSIEQCTHTYIGILRILRSAGDGATHCRGYSRADVQDQCEL